MIKTLLSIIPLAICAISVMAHPGATNTPQTTQKADDEADDDDAEEDATQASMRINPLFDSVPPPPDYNRVDYSRYPWLNLAANHISMNGDNWGSLQRRLTQADGGAPVRILLIGDSHIQGDAGTGVVRHMLQQRFGNAGRGFVAPLKMIGSNQPRDYRISSSTPGWRGARLLKKPWASEMLFTGASLTPRIGDFDLTVEVLPSPGPRPFSEARIFYGGVKPLVTKVTGKDGMPVEFYTDDSRPGCIYLSLDQLLEKCTIDFTTSGTTQIGGIQLLHNNDGGVEFSTIGNNGAAFQSYLGLDTGIGISMMEPELVILAMGTNEAWGNMTDSQFTTSIDRLVKEIRATNPGVKILLTTPAEAQKRHSTRVGTQATRRKGKKGRRRRKARYVTTYAPNQKVGHFRNLIVAYGREHNIPVYDFYAVAGGNGSSHKWVGAGLFGGDRVHLSWPGYTLMGQLHGDALLDALDIQKCPVDPGTQATPSTGI